MELIERIGAFLGLAAFLGFAILALLYFQQARDVRRLREWAGKAPERATAQGAVAPPADAASGARRGRLGSAGAAVRGGLARIGENAAAAWGAADRNSPLDPRILAGILVLAGLAAAALATGGFGLLGDDAGKRRAARETPLDPADIEVAVLNGTASGSAPVPGLADTGSREVERSGYELGAVGDTGDAYAESLVMYAAGHEDEARLLADDLRSKLGDTPVEKLVEDVRDRAGGAKVVLVLGQDDDGL